VHKSPEVVGGPWRYLTRSLGKQWHEPKKAFRPRAGNNSYEKRARERAALAAMKAKEKEMKDEKEADRQVRTS
jgi:rRNA-processing protein CGR1